MSKAILVMDMPKTCYECRLSKRLNPDEFVLCDGKIVSDTSTIFNLRPGWCPLQTWIPVTKQKPSNKDDVHVTLRDGTKDTCWYADEFDEWYDSQYNKKDVIAWIPFNVEAFSEKD